jgi:hypothetical protein
MNVGLFDYDGVSLKRREFSDYPLNALSHSLIKSYRYILITLN